MHRLLAVPAIALGSVIVSAAAVSAAPPDSTAPAPVDKPDSATDGSEASVVLSGGSAEADGPMVTSDTGAPTGEAVVFVDEAGTALATIELVSVEEDWQGFAEYYEPDNGHRYLRMVVSVTSQSPRGLFEVDASGFVLQDADGFAYGPNRVRTVEEDAAGVDPVEEGSLANGESIELTLTFEVVVGVAPTALFFSPSYDRLLTVAQLG